MRYLIDALTSRKADQHRTFGRPIGTRTCRSLATWIHVLAALLAAKPTAMQSGDRRGCRPMSSSLYRASSALGKTWEPRMSWVHALETPEEESPSMATEPVGVADLEDSGVLSMPSMATETVGSPWGASRVSKTMVPRTQVGSGCRRRCSSQWGFGSRSCGRGRGRRRVPPPPASRGIPTPARSCDLEGI